MEPKNVPKSPCAAQNVGFYHDLTRDDYHPRHSACCAWFKTFLNQAWTEYPDLKSKQIIDTVNNEEGSLSLYDKARQLVRHYDAWSSATCHKGSTTTDASCCAACLSTNIPNKLKKYTAIVAVDVTTHQPPDGASNTLCSYFGDGWCGVHQGDSGSDDDAARTEHGLALSQQNPSIMVDGAFKSRPTKKNVNQYQGEPGHTYATTATSSTQIQQVVSSTTKVDVVHASVHVPVVPDAVPYVTPGGGPDISIPGKFSSSDFLYTCGLRN